MLSYRLKLVWKHVWQPCRTIACRLQPCSLDFRMHFHFTSPKNTHLASSKSDFIPIIPLLGQKLSNHTHTETHTSIYPLPTAILPLLTCFIVVGRELVQHLTIHGQDALLEDAGVRVSALSLLSLKGLQLLPQGFWQVGLHIVSCSLGERD